LDKSRDIKNENQNIECQRIIDELFKIEEDAWDNETEELNSIMSRDVDNIFNIMLQQYSGKRKREDDIHNDEDHLQKKRKT